MPFVDHSNPQHHQVGRFSFGGEHEFVATCNGVSWKDGLVLKEYYYDGEYGNDIEIREWEGVTTIEQLDALMVLLHGEQGETQ